MNKSRIRIFITVLESRPTKPDHYSFNFLKQFDFIFESEWHSTYL